VHSAVVSWLVGVLTGGAILAIGDGGHELYLLAGISGAVFGDLARRARRERLSGPNDSTILAGVRLRAVSVRALGANYAVRLGTRRDQALVRHGPYRLVRHPNYASLLIIACGIALALASPLALVATFTLWLPIVVLRIVREERMLVERFAERYREYRRGTWRLVPGLY
jgi:protein-S-isoprenylcysteine O-methyltransferase